MFPQYITGRAGCQMRLSERIKYAKLYINQSPDRKERGGNMRAFLRRLARPYEADGKFVASADLLRIISVYVIAWYHIWQQSWLNPVLRIGSVRIDFNPLVRTGYLMVDLLLMLSGFLLFLPYARCRLEQKPFPRIGEYYKKRAARILPSYLFCIFVVLFCFALPRGEYGNAKHLWTDLIGHLTFTHNLNALSYQSTRLNGALWTLAVEVQFYLIAPFVCRAFARKPLPTYLAMTAAAFAYRFFYVLPMGSHSLHFNRLPAMLDVYANGMMGALIYAALCKHAKKSGWTALAATVVSALCVCGIYHLMLGQMRESGYPAIHIGQMVRRFPLSAAGALFTVSAGLSFHWLARLISCGPVRWLSAISYNVYIWHAYAAIKMKEWHIPAYVNPSPNQAGEQPWQLHYTLLSLGAAVALGALITYCIERPAAKLILRKKRS